MNLLILGAGGHGNVIRSIAEEFMEYETILFLDDQSEKAVGKLKDYIKFHKNFTDTFVAIGNSDLRRQWLEELVEAGYQIPVICHPKAYVSANSRIGMGTVVMPGAVIQSNVEVGIGCIISSGAVIDHNAVINDYCHINAGSIVPSMSHVPKGTKISYGEIYADV